MQTAKLQQESVISGQFVTCFQMVGISYDLAKKICLFLTFQCLSFLTHL
jgi:hypothetical protein